MIVYLTLFCLLGSWIATTAVGRQIAVSYWLVAGGLSFVASIWLHRHGIVTKSGQDERASIVLACLMALALGAARSQLVQEQVCELPQVCAFNDTPRSVKLTGLVVDEPDIGDRSVQLRVRVDSITYRTLENPDGVTVAVEGDVLVSSQRFPVIAYGSELEIIGNLETPFDSAEFSYKEYLAQENIYSTLFFPRIELLAENQGNPILAAIFGFKQDAANTIARVVPAPQSGLLKAILLGDKSDLPEIIEDDFRIAGLAHLIAISGFHVAIIMVSVLTVVEVFVRPGQAVAITAVVLLLYGVLVGGRPSVVRAVIMGIAWMVASRLLGRRNATIGVLAFVALVMTIWDPRLLWNVGFQLSFAATLGIALFATPLDEWLREKATGWVSLEIVEGGFGRILSILAVSTAAQILTLPLVGWHFEQLSLISIFANLIVVPLQPLAMLLGGAATLIGLAIEPLGRLIGWLAWLPLSYTTEAVALLARVPLASVPIRITNYSLVFLYTVIGAAGWYGLQGRTRRAELREQLMVNFSEKLLLSSGGLAAVLVIAWSGSQPDGRLHVTFFDVGQGDATLIVTPGGRQVLIDGGHFPSIMNAHLGRAIPFWDREIDMVIATHPDADHVTGLATIFDRYKVGQFVYDGNLASPSQLYDATLERVEKYKVPKHAAIAGEVIVIDEGVRLEIVHPGEVLDEDVRNNNSVSIRLVYGDFSVLLTGDAEKEAEQQMLASGLPLEALVYKVGHHGSETSTTQAFLDVVRPKIAILSAGSDNRFGHPHPDVVARLHAAGVSILDTRDLGTISVATDGQQMWWLGGGK